MQLGVRPALRPPDLPRALVVCPRFSPAIEAVRCDFREVASIMMVFCSMPSDASPSIIRVKTPMSPNRFHRLQSVFRVPCSRGASHLNRAGFAGG